MSVQILKAELIKLSKAEQAELMHFMIELLTDDSLILSEEWKKELDSREQALKSGDATGKPASDVLSKYKPQ